MSDPQTSWIYDVTEQNFHTHVVAASQERPVVLDFWAPWCEPCEKLGPMLERLINERKGKILLARVNVDQAQQLAMELGVQRIPAIKAVYQGQLVSEFDGALPEAQVRQFLDQLAPAEQESPLDRARALEATNPAEAESLYRLLLKDEEMKDAASVGLARALLAQNKPDEVGTLLDSLTLEGALGQEAERLKSQLYFRKLMQGPADETALRARVQANSKDAQAHFDLGCLLAARGQYEQALAELLAAAENDLKLAAGKVREVMVKIFYALGANHPLSNQYRSKLAQLLY
jgi:putative thioredoxin